MAESSGQLGGKDDVRQVQGPRLDTSSPEVSSAASPRDDSLAGETTREDKALQSGGFSPYYEDGSVTLYHGDARDIVPTLGAVDLVVTDPPYGIGWKPPVNHQDTPWDDVLVDVRFALVGKHHCLWGGNYFTDMVPPSESWLVWIKRPAGFDFDEDPRSYAMCEMAWTDYGHKPRTKHFTWDGGKRAGDGSNREFLHPAQKPLELMRWCIALCPLEPPFMVLDPFAGSGTTLRAAKDLGVRAIGIEIEERYCEIAAKRMGQEVLDFGEAA